MKTIKVSNEMYDSLMQISKGLNTQDHRSTAMPYFFQIQTKEEVVTARGIGEEKYLYDGDFFDYTELEEIWAEQDYESVEEMIEGLDIEEINTEIVKNYENAFFTEKACRSHIKQNHYHYNNPVDYLSYARRNPEMELVMKFLCELSGGELHK